MGRDVGDVDRPVARVYDDAARPTEDLGAERLPSPAGRVERDETPVHAVRDDEPVAMGIPREAERAAEGLVVLAGRPRLVAPALQVEDVHDAGAVVADEHPAATVRADAEGRHHGALRLHAEERLAENLPAGLGRGEVAVGAQLADVRDAGRGRRRRPLQRRLERLEDHAGRPAAARAREQRDDEREPGDAGAMRTSSELSSESDDEPLE